MNGDNAYIVEFNGVSLNYHDAQGETPAIRGLDFGVKKGEFVSIVGPSGCGKTSVLSIAAGIAVPSGGSVRIEGGRPGCSRTICWTGARWKGTYCWGLRCRAI